MSLVETEIGSIAPDWKIVRLKDVAEKPQYGLTAKAAISGDTKFLRITDITDQRVNWATVPFCSAPKKKIDTCKLKSGDIVFARIGATTGKSYMISDPPDAVFASYLIRVRVGNDLDPNFLIHFFQSWGYWQQVDANKHANLKKGVNGSILSNLLLPLPPLPEQKKIAYILSTVQRAIEAQERIIQITTELKKALMHKLFTEGLRNEPQKQTEIGPIPESWEVVPLDEIGQIERGKFSHRPRNEPRFYGGDYPFVQTGDVSNCDGYVRSYTQTLNDEGLAISKMFPAGTILITIAANIGFTGILQFDSACPDSLIGISPSKCVQAEFLNYYLITQQPKMDQLAPKGTQKNINIQFLKPWPIPLPDQEEQEKISEVLVATDNKIRIASVKRHALQDLFRTFLHELMTAKTRARNFGLST